jgi:hypothetical protein
VVHGSDSSGVVGSVTAPDYADRIAAQLLDDYLTPSFAFDEDQRQLVQVIVTIAARRGYVLRDGVGK